MEYSYSSDWAKTRRLSIAHGCSSLDLVESSLVYTANRLAVQSFLQAARPTLLVAKHEAFSRIDCSGYLCFLCKSIHYPFCFPPSYSHAIRHSKESSTSGSTATLSPVEQQRGFGHLSTINENGYKTGDALSASSEGHLEEMGSPSRSWLTKFLVEAHLSAPNRRWEARSKRAPVPLVGRQINH